MDLRANLKQFGLQQVPNNTDFIAVKDMALEMLEDGNTDLAVACWCFRKMKGREVLR